jgi:hypothetical protein
MGTLEGVLPSMLFFSTISLVYYFREMLIVPSSLLFMMSFPRMNLASHSCSGG